MSGCAKSHCVLWCHQAISITEGMQCLVFGPGGQLVSMVTLQVNVCHYCHALYAMKLADHRGQVV